MYNLSDEEFDHLCRKAAENPGAEIPADGWERLKQRLDREMPEDEDQRRRRPFWIPFLIFLPFSLLYWLDHTGALVDTRDKAPASIVAHGPEPLSTKPPAQQKADKEDISANTVDITPGIRVKAESPASGQVYVEVRKKAFGDRPSSPDRLKVLRKDEVRRKVTPTAFFENKVDSRSGKGLITEPVVSPINPQIPNVEKASMGDKIPAVDGVPAMMPDSSQHATTPRTAVTADDAKDRKGKKGLGFSLLAGPDWSNVSFAATDKTGFNIGALAEYRFAKRWTVQVGLLYSRKHYTALGDETGGYPGYDPSNPNLKMNKVKANCYMWDIPANIRFDFMAKKNQWAYAGIGLSSYLMKKEDLHYYYTYNNDPRYKAWENTNPSMYLLSTANLLAGYEFRFSRDFSLRLESFFKLPLRPIGYGNIQLNSLGFLFGMTYRPFVNTTTSQKSK